MYILFHNKRFLSSYDDISNFFNIICEIEYIIKIYNDYFSTKRFLTFCDIYKYLKRDNL